MMKNNLLSIFEELCVKLGLENEKPVLLIGKEAVKFVKNHYSNRGKKIFTLPINGMFLYEGLDVNYLEDNNIDKRCIKNGVVCLFKKRKATLVHEMRHAYQLKNNPEYMFLESNEDLRKEYKAIYAYYPSEKDAFTYTIKYLKEESDKVYSFHMNDGNILEYILSYWKIKLAQSNHFLYKLNYSLLKIDYYYKNKRFIKKSKSATQLN